MVVTCILVGTIIFAGVQGIIIRVLTMGDPDEILFKQNLDSINHMMVDQRLPKWLQLRVRDYYLKTRRQTKRESYFELIKGCLSRQLGGEVRSRCDLAPSLDRHLPPISS